eukprot:TRINITY_DN11061_c0_g4_i1.p1 TRINITY_DN11061_c0_g4~~TRINITY_DN11061_c0_g4_i1.p1  ORF type:complete len:113 (+),score=11.17 TRINITY_DN11061_c0_g4_i1:309-647(+)
MHEEKATRIIQKSILAKKDVQHSIWPERLSALRCLVLKLEKKTAGDKARPDAARDNFLCQPLLLEHKLNSEEVAQYSCGATMARTKLGLRCRCTFHRANILQDEQLEGDLSV